MYGADRGCWYEYKYYFLGAFGVVGLVLTITLISLSVNNVQQDENALHYGAVTRHFRGSVLGPGRVLLQPDSKLITYKNTFVPWENTVDCWTKDGLETILTVAVQTRYVPEELFDIAFEFGDEGDFLPFVTEIISELIRDECSKFTSFNFYDVRGEVQQNMTRRIEADLPRLSTHIRSGGFLQLKNIVLPAGFNTAIVNKRLAEQDIILRANERTQRIIVANTQLSQANNNATVAVNAATQHARAVSFAAEQQAAAITTLYQQRLFVYKTGADALNMSVDDYVHQILAVSILAGQKDLTLFV